MWRALFYVVFLSTCLGVSLAQDRALISGDAEDAQDVPVAGVQVTLQNPALRVERTTTTNSDGFYFFAEVSPAEGYVITASAPGMTFAPQSVKFDVEVGETRHILPSFVVGKAQPPVSNQRRGQPLDPAPGFRLPDALAMALSSACSLRPVWASLIAAQPKFAVPAVYANCGNRRAATSARLLDSRASEKEFAALPRLRQLSHSVLGESFGVLFSGRHENDTD